MEYVYPVIAGGVAGTAASVIFHPLDTLKTIKQSGKKIDRGHMNLRVLYRGLGPAAGIQILGNGLLFGLYDFFKTNDGVDFAASFKTGAVEAILYTGLEIKKTGQQLSSADRGWRGLPKQLGIMTSRETIGNCLYFGTYEHLKTSGFSTLTSGGFAGVAFWAFSFPFDTMRLNVQLGKPILSKGLYSGYSYALLRSFPSNATIFLCYQNTINYLNTL